MFTQSSSDLDRNLLGSTATLRSILSSACFYPEWLNFILSLCAISAGPGWHMLGPGTNGSSYGWSARWRSYQTWIQNTRGLGKRVEERFCRLAYWLRWSVRENYLHVIWYAPIYFYYQYCAIMVGDAWKFSFDTIPSIDQFPYRYWVLY